MRELPSMEFPGFTALGAMGKYISASNRHFQPMNCTFGIIDPIPLRPGQKRIRDKKERYDDDIDPELFDEGDEFVHDRLIFYF